MKQNKIRELSLCGLFSALLVVGAFIKISIPLQPFPMHFTLQLFFALLAGFLLGPRLGLTCVCVYLLLGLLGIPVFAAGGGLSYLLRPTFGFLIGFAFTALLAGFLIKQMAKPPFWRLLLAALGGMMAYYICGMLYFYFISNYAIHMPVTWPMVLINCFLITLIPDSILCVCAAFLALRLLPVIRKLN